MALAVMILSAGCSDRHDAFGRFTRLPEEGWAYNDTVRITASGLDSVASPKNFRIGVVHDNDYEFRNLVLEVTCRTGNRIRRDTIDLELADAYGAWKGSGLGPEYQAEASVSPKVLIGDSSEIFVRHVMRTDTLRGINKIGIIIEKP